MITTKYITSDNKTFDNLADAEKHETKISAPARTLVWTGHSDDIVSLSEWQAGKQKPIDEYDEKRTFLVRDQNGNGLKVFTKYDGCWGFGINLLDEDKELPNWPIRFGSWENGYSIELQIEVPAGVTVKTE